MKLVLYMPDLAYYRSIRRAKKRFSGKHAKFVGLMENGVVKKVYHEENKDIFEHEVYVLKRLQGNHFIPKLYAVDEERFTIYMQYCGNPLNNLDRYRHKIQKYKQILETKYGFFHNDIRLGNVCKDSTGQLYLIDFGWCREFKGIGGYGKGKIGNPTTSLPVTKKTLLDLLKEIYLDQGLAEENRKKIAQVFKKEKEKLPSMENEEDNEPEAESPDDDDETPSEVDETPEDEDETPEDEDETPEDEDETPEDQDETPEDEDETHEDQEEYLEAEEEKDGEEEEAEKDDEEVEPEKDDEEEKAEKDEEILEEVKEFSGDDEEIGQLVPELVDSSEEQPKNIVEIKLKKWNEMETEEVQITLKQVSLINEDNLGVQRQGNPYLFEF